MPKPNRNKIIYGIATAWLALGMLSTGAGQIIKMKEGQGALDMMVHLGYPEYLLTLLGVWKILGVVAVLMPARRLFVNLLKEWAYAGFFFAMSLPEIQYLSLLRKQ